MRMAETIVLRGAPLLPQGLLLHGKAKRMSRAVPASEARSQVPRSRKPEPRPVSWACGRWGARSVHRMAAPNDTVCVTHLGNQSAGLVGSKTADSINIRLVREAESVTL